jgi:selenocysteine lyase/cysteine desulfurase
VPTFTFNLPGKTPAEIAQALGKEDIYIWDGNFYALDISRRYGVEDVGGFARVGAVHYNTLDEIRHFGEVLKRIAAA